MGFQGVRGLWFYVSLSNSDWIPVLVDHGFVFHHARPDSVALIKWLPDDETYQVRQDKKISAKLIN